MRDLRQREKAVESSYKESQISVCQIVTCNQFVGFEINSVSCSHCFQILDKLERMLPPCLLCNQKRIKYKNLSALPLLRISFSQNNSLVPVGVHECLYPCVHAHMNQGIRCKLLPMSPSNLLTDTTGELIQGSEQYSTYNKTLILTECFKSYTYIQRKM